MLRFRNLPDAAAAVGAFVLTVLLGLGGASASALWQQSATATMAVTAAWGEQAFSGFNCTNDNPQKVATLTAAGSRAPASLTYAALQANGTYGPSYSDGVSLGATSTVSLTITSPLIAANRSTTQLTVRVTATYADQTQTTATATLRLEQGNNSDKVICVSPLA